MNRKGGGDGRGTGKEQEGKHRQAYKQLNSYAVVWENASRHENIQRHKEKRKKENIHGETIRTTTQAIECGVFYYRGKKETHVVSLLAALACRKTKRCSTIISASQTKCPHAQVASF